MNYCNILPNSEILYYFIIIILIIPYLLLVLSKTHFIKYYLLYLVPISYIIMKLDHTGKLKNLYNIDTYYKIKTHITTDIIKLLTLIGIIWNVIFYSNKYNLITGLLYGIFLFIIKIPMTEYLLEKILKTLQTYDKNSNVKLKYNILLLIVGIFYIIGLLLLQFVFLYIVKMIYKNKHTLNNSSIVSSVVKNISLSNPKMMV
jgi:hypothetical protein